MKSNWLIKNNSKKLILFFNGWSLDENIVKHLTSSEYDVLMLFDYSNLDLNLSILKEIYEYEEINVIAWSYGVWAYGSVLDIFKNLKNVVAINGTLLPINNDFGISERMFNLTLSNLSEKNYPRFFQNMFEGEGDLYKMPQRNIEDQRQELKSIQRLCAQKDISKNKTFFTKVFTGLKDKIIPAQNQINFWGGNIDIIKVNTGHYMFDLFSNWDEIING